MTASLYVSMMSVTPVMAMQSLVTLVIFVMVSWSSFGAWLAASMRTASTLGSAWTSWENKAWSLSMASCMASLRVWSSWRMVRSAWSCGVGVSCAWYVYTFSPVVVRRTVLMTSWSSRPRRWWRSFLCSLAFSRLALRRCGPSALLRVVRRSWYRSGCVRSTSSLVANVSCGFCSKIVTNLSFMFSLRS